MKPTERMHRRWSQFTMEDVQKLADLATPEQYSHTNLAKGEYMPPFSEKLNGRKFRFFMDNGETYVYEFTDTHEVKWEKNGEDSHLEYNQILELPDAGDIYLIQHHCKGSVPPTVHTLVLDLNTGLVTICIASAGVEDAPREIQRTFYFGIIEGYKDTGKRHSFTEDLVGTSIYWTYHENPKVKIKHIYSAPLYYTYQMLSDKGQCWMASNPANYVKITDKVYVFSFVEERQAGTQGFFLINMKTLHDVGAFFGIQAHGMESCMVGAKGELSSPYAFDWCETKAEK